MYQTEYLKCDTHLPVYFPLPQFIVDADISSTSKLLFAVLLNRANLSQKNVWEDENGNIYCVYPIEDLAKVLGKGKTTVKNALNELSGCGLLERVRADFGRANRLYIKLPRDVDTVSKPPLIEPENRHSVGHKSKSKKASYPTPNNYIKQQNINYKRDVRFMDYSYEEGESL